MNEEYDALYDEQDRNKHDDKVNELKIEREAITKKGHFYLIEQVKKNNETDVLFLLGCLLNELEELKATTEKN